MAERSERSILSIVFLIVFVDMVGFGILIPVIPLLLADPASPYFLLTKGTPIGTGYEMLGLLLATYSIMQFLSAPILGQLSDRFGRKKLLAVSVFGTFLSYILFGIGIMTANIPLLFFSRAIDGVTGGNISIAQAIVADVTKPENRAKNFGLVGAAFGLGFIIGPFIGGKLSDPTVLNWFNAATPFFFASILSFVEVLLILLILPETLKRVGDAARMSWLKSVRNIAKVFRNRSIRAILGTVFLFQSGFTFFTTFVAVYYISRFGFTQGSIGNMFAYVGVCIALTQLVILRRLPKNKEYAILRITLIGSGIMLLAYVVPSAPWQLLLIIPVFSVFSGITQAYLPAVVSRSADGSVQGEVLGINASVASLAQAIPPVISGYFAAISSPEVPLIVAGIVALSAAVLFLALHPRSRDDVAAGHMSVQS